MKEKMLTNQDLFHWVHNKLKEENLLPNHLDYGSAYFMPHYFYNDHIRILFDLNYGGSEGIYLKLYACGNFGKGMESQQVCLGTFKTLSTDDNSMRQMGILAADFILHTQEFLEQFEEQLCWTGWTIKFYNKDERLQRTLTNYSAMTLNDVIAQYQHSDAHTIIAYNNATRKSYTIETIS